MRRCASDAQKLEQLRRLIREIEYLKYTLNSTLYWDKMTYMPEKGLTYRSEVMSFLGAQLYERFRSRSCGAWSIIFPGRRTLRPKFPQWFEG